MNRCTNVSISIHCIQSIMCSAHVWRRDLWAERRFATFQGYTSVHQQHPQTHNTPTLGPTPVHICNTSFYNYRCYESLQDPWPELVPFIQIPTYCRFCGAHFPFVCVASGVARLLPYFPAQYGNPGCSALQIGLPDWAEKYSTIWQPCVALRVIVTPWADTLVT